MGMRRSWFMTAVVRYTSPMEAPIAWNPPHVPALINRSVFDSSFSFSSARKVASAAGMVPTLSTPVPCTSSFPFVIMVRLQEWYVP